MTETMDAKAGDDVLAFPIDRGGRLTVPEEYHDLLRHNPVARAVLSYGLPVWLITRFADAQQALTDPRFSADFRSPGCPWPGGRRPVPVGVATSFGRKDPPEHTLYRTALLPEFSAHRIRRMRPAIQRVVDGVLDEMAAMAGPVDFYQALALPTVTRVICQMLGIPYQEHAFFQRQMRVIVSSRSTPEETTTAFQRTRDFLADLLAFRRDNPGDDVMTILARLQIQHGLADEDVCATAQSLLNAGQESTSNTISLGTLLLLKHPDQLGLLRREPDRWPAAVEEMMRYLSVVDLGCPRAALADVEIGGTRIRAGEGVFVLLGAADYDETVFEDPRTFDVTRPRRPNLSFGYGVHLCIGHNLARAELEIVFPSLFRRFPELRLAVPYEELSFRTDVPAYGVNSMPVTW